MPDPPVPEREIELWGPLIIRLNDTAGDSFVGFKDSNGDIVFKVDSLGNVLLKGLAVQADTITDP